MREEIAERIVAAARRYGSKIAPLAAPPDRTDRGRVDEEKNLPILRGAVVISPMTANGAGIQ